MSKNSKVHEINMFHYNPQQRPHISVSIKRRRKHQPGVRKGQETHRAYTFYDESITHMPELRISFASLMRLRHVLGELFEAGKVEGFIWPCEFDHTLNGCMRIKDEVLANK